MTALSVVLSLYLAAPHPANASEFGITCDMISVEHHDKITYHFNVDANDPSYVREASVWRNGAKITPDLLIHPVWKVTSTTYSTTLWSAADQGWSLTMHTYGANGAPVFYWGTTIAEVISPSNRVVSQGSCTRTWDEETIIASTPAPAEIVPASVVAPAPAPVVAQAPTREPVTEDVIPLIIVDKTSALINVVVGGRSLVMTVDTGASDGTLPTTFANTLIADGKAVEGESEKVSLADGSIVTSRTVTVHTVVVGGHTIHDIKFGVSPDKAEALFGFNALTALGAFRIDAKRGVLTLG
jgi:hypothetical protein